MGAIGDKQKPIAGEHLGAQIALLDEVVLQVAPGEQQNRAVRREIRMLALQPRARAAPRIGERVGLARCESLGGIRRAGALAEHYADAVPSGALSLGHEWAREGKGMCAVRAARGGGPMLPKRMHRLLERSPR